METNKRYTPKIMKSQHVEREIFTQNIDDLDLKKVIKAINDL